MRNMSFAITTKQVYERTKFVTRRLGWKNLKVGEHFMACEKCQGLGAGGKMVKINELVCRSNTPEPLAYLLLKTSYAKREVVLEGFPKMTGKQFVEMFCHEMGCDPLTTVNRIEFGYIDTDGRIIYPPTNADMVRHWKSELLAEPWVPEEPRQCAGHRFNQITIDEFHDAQERDFNPEAC